MTKINKNNQKNAPKEEGFKAFAKRNLTLISFGIVGFIILSVAVVSPQTFSFQKDKAQSSGFGGYQLPDKSSMNSSLPTRIIWNEPSFMEKK